MSSNLSYILFNNRSTELTESIVDSDIDELSAVDRLLLKFLYGGIEQSWQLSNANVNSLMIDRNKYDFDTEADDILFNRKELAALTSYVQRFALSQKNRTYLQERGLTDETIEHFKFSDMPTANHDMLGISLHPSLRKAMIAGSIDGIGLPILTDGRLTNYITRRFSGQMKYCQAIPATDIFEAIRPESNIGIIAEGTMCMASSYQMGYNSFSVSNATWTPMQIFKLCQLAQKHRHITEWYIFADNDTTGIRSALKLWSNLPKKLQRSFKVITTTDKGLKDVNDLLKADKDIFDNLHDLTDLDYKDFTYDGPQNFFILENLIEKNTILRTVLLRKQHRAG